MAGTQAGARKIAAQLKIKHGVDAHGRSLFHATIGSLGGENSHGGGYFKRLKLEDPVRLSEIAHAGGDARKKQIEGKHEIDNLRRAGQQVQ